MPVLITAMKVVATGLLLALAAFWIWVGLSQRYSRPPLWVAGAHRRSPENAVVMLGVCFLGMALGGFAWPGVFLSAIPGLLMVGGFVLWVAGSWIYFPRLLLPRWYRAARRAGVDVRDPQAVQSFRDRRRQADPPIRPGGTAPTGAPGRDGREP